MIGKLDSTRLLALAGVLGPLGAVLVARSLLSVGPAEAPAAEADPVMPSITAMVPARLEPQLSAPQQAAADYVRGLTGQGVRSPMTKPVPEPDVVVEAAPVVEPVFDPAAVLDLTSVVGSGERAIAQIDGRLRRVGDEVAPGWAVAAIDVAGRSVLLRHTDGRESILRYAREN